MDMKKNYLENEFIKLWIEDGILFGEYKQNLMINYESAVTIVAARLATCAGKDYPHVLNITGIRSTSKDARDYFSKGDGIKHMKSMALITDSPVSRTIGNFFLLLNKPTVPTKIFTKGEEAIEWSKNLADTALGATVE